MIPAVGAWKRDLAKQHGTVWQHNCFDHRPRTEATRLAEAHYILQNPVRAGLMRTAEEWPLMWVPPLQQQHQGRLGEPPLPVG